MDRKKDDEWTDKVMDGWMDEWKDKCTDFGVDGWMDGQLMQWLDLMDDG